MPCWPTSTLPRCASLSHVHVAFDDSLRGELTCAAARRRGRARPCRARRQCADGRVRRRGRRSACARPRSPGRRWPRSACTDKPCAIVPSGATRCSSPIRRDSPSEPESPSSPISAAATLPRVARARRWSRHSTRRCSRCRDRHRVIVNLGGIANITDLPRQAWGAVRGFDTGPGNTLIDAWSERHTGERFDRDGAWAASWRDHRAAARRACVRRLLPACRRPRAPGATSSTCRGSSEPCAAYTPLATSRVR